MDNLANTIFNSTDKLPIDMTELVRQIAPQTYADAAAITVVGLASAAYFLRDYTWDKPDPYRYVWYERPQAQDGATNQANKTTRNIAERLEELVSLFVINTKKKMIGDTRPN